MTYYKKPSNVSYTQMCIWIDNNVYNKDCDENLVFEYLYHITRMLAYKRRFFEKAEYYDDFAIYAATRIFMRLKDKRQFEDDSKLTKIKSVLNYAKNILYPTKIAFENDAYAQNYIKTGKEDYYPNLDFHSSLTNSINNLRVVDFSFCLDNIVKTIKSFVYSLPYSSKIEIQNIYISCILSLLNSVVLSNKNKEKLNKLKELEKLKMSNIDRLYKKERDSCVILYHLDISKKSYITVIVNELRHLIAEDLSNILNEDIESESNMKSLLMSSINMDLKNDNNW